MIEYTYTAHNPVTGQVVKAMVQADSEQAAAKLLIRQKLFPIEIKPRGARKFDIKIGTGVKSKERVLFTRQLATLINAGLPLAQSLRTVREQVNSKRLGVIADQIRADVEDGSTLAAAFGKYPRVFNQIYVSLVAAGETSGTLDKSLERIATQQEKDAAIASKIRGALVYPVIVLVVILLVLVFMLTTVVPQVAKLYIDLKKPLPGLTAGLVSVANILLHFWWLMILGMIGLFFALRAYGRTEAGRSLFDRFKLHVPLFGKLFRKVYMARFCRTLGTLLASGIPMLEALRVVQRAVGNVHVAASVEHAIGGVRGGKALSDMLTGDPNFIVLVPQMIKIGEQSGAIDQMLDKIANLYEDEVDVEVKNLSTTIEPALMVVLGITVGGVITAILLPIYSLVGSGVS